MDLITIFYRFYTWQLRQQLAALKTCMKNGIRKSSVISRKDMDNFMSIMCCTRSPLPRSLNLPVIYRWWTWVVAEVSWDSTGYILPWKYIFMVDSINKNLKLWSCGRSGWPAKCISTTYQAGRYQKRGIWCRGKPGGCPIKRAVELGKPLIKKSKWNPRR